ncbi:MAG: hypothetical protein V3V50_02785 [Gammaproteobacteria bacterium]
MHLKQLINNLVVSSLMAFTGGLFFSAGVFAQTLVLVPGYQSDGGIWRKTGFVNALLSAGWQDAGHVMADPYGVRMLVEQKKSERRFFTVNLPAEAPLIVQANILSAQLNAIRNRFQDEPLLLAGHSVGGVVARLAMVREPALKLDALITFAAPHLGTGMAEAGLGISQSPIGWVAPLLGASTINRSRELYADLMRERPGSLLFWLNRQPHPESKYYSVVRSQHGGFSNWRDQVVDPFSQDMNNVVALRGKSLFIASPLKHGLHPADGVLLADLLKQCCK